MRTFVWLMVSGFGVAACWGGAKNDGGVDAFFVMGMCASLWISMWRDILK